MCGIALHAYYKHVHCVVFVSQRDRESLSSLRSTLQSEQARLQEEHRKHESATSDIRERQSVLETMNAELQTKLAECHRREQQLQENERVSGGLCGIGMLHLLACVAVALLLRVLPVMLLFRIG